MWPHLHKVILLLAVLVGIAVNLAFPKWTVDDAFISYRYGVNFAEGHGLVWNPGEEPVEGFTGIALPMLAAAAHQLGYDIILTVKIIMLLSWSAIGLLLWTISKNLKIKKIIASTSIFVFVLNPILYTHLWSGLETLLFAVLMLSMVAFIVKTVNDLNLPLWVYLAFPVLAVMLCLVRPEGMAISPLLTVVFMISVRRKASTSHLMWLFIAVAITGLLFFIYTNWRMKYFGDFFPNTFYAKRFDGFFSVEPWLELLHTLAVTVGPILVAIGLGAFLLLKPGGIKALFRSRWNTIIPCISIPLILALGYSRSHLFMNYSHRFFAPVVPLMLVVIMVFADGVLGAWQEKRGAGIPQKATAWMAVLAMVGQLAFFGIKLRTEVAWCGYYQRVMEQEWKPVAALLKAELPADATVALYMDAGWIGYASGRRCLDFGKLNDRTLAKGPHESAFVADYFFKEMPEAAVFTSFSEDTLDYIPEALFIQADPRFEKYKLFRKFKTDIKSDRYFQFVYFRE